MGKETVITAPTMAEALSKVRRELGIDALILSHEESLGNVSITARVENVVPLQQQGNTRTEIPDWIRPSSIHRKQDESNQASPSASNAESKAERIEIPARRSDFKKFINSASSFDETLSAISAVCDLCDFHQLGEALGEAWLKEMNPEFTHHPIQLTPALDRVISTDPIWLDNISSAGQIVLVGPPGCGKTVTIAKLAAMLLERGKKVRIITLDTLKASGAWQLEEYLEPLSLRIYVGPDYLPDTRPKEIILIDTPALNINLQHDRDYLKALKTKVNVPFTLVLPADMNPVDAEEIAASYRDANTKTIIVTRLELSRRCGVPLRAAYQGLKLVLTSKSPNLAEGLQCVTPESMLERMLTACEASL
ncbi:MAG: hypothetical protein V4482_04845 [Pseudomonadota bacterium]